MTWLSCVFVWLCPRGFHAHRWDKHVYFFLYKYIYESKHFCKLLRPQHLQPDPWTSCPSASTLSPNTFFHLSKAQLVHFLDKLPHQKRFERTVFQDFGPLFSLCCSWSHRTFKQCNVLGKYEKHEPPDLFSLFSGSGGGTVLVDNVQLN